MKEIDEKELKTAIEKAFAARQYSYVPYSNFRVGACLVAADGEMISGCNIENSSFSATNCAERTAIFKAILEGKRNFKYIVIVGGKDGTEDFDFCPPCGVCRQVMTEFCDLHEFNIVLAKSVDEYKIYSLDEIIPFSFNKNHL